MAFLHSYRYYILFLLYGFHLCFAWPGELVSDSQGQYAQALAGVYDDHHPPLMSFIWRYLDKIYKGPGLMLILQLSLLYGGWAAFLKSYEEIFSFKNQWTLFLAFFLLPLYPSLLGFSLVIQKDNYFAYSFFFLAGLLSYFSLSMRRLPWYALTFMMPILIYGTAVKYQARFCSVVILIWMANRLVPRSNTLIKGILSAALILGLYTSVEKINRILVPVTKSSNAWQYVKLYDLASISVDVNKDLIPHFNKTASYTYEKLRSRLTHIAVDPFIYSQDNIFRKTQEPSEMQELQRVWWQTVLEHPMYYLKHRILNFSHMALGRLHYDVIKGFLHTWMPVSSPLTQLIHKGVGVIYGIFMSYVVFVFLAIIYFVLALCAWKRTPVAPVLLGLTSMSLLMLGILFFLSMAGVTRYIYICALMVQVSHLFAFKVWKILKGPPVPHSKIFKNLSS